jgi:hypothetical protein
MPDLKYPWKTVREVPMSQQSPEKEARKKAMKALRNARKQQIAAASAKMKEQKKAIKAIREALGGDGATVPVVVEQTGMASAEVLWYLATMKKYGEILEGEKDGGYFRYKPVSEEAAP